MAVTANALWREGVRKLIGEAVEMAMALGLSGGFSSVFVRGVSSGRTTDNDFSFSPAQGDSRSYGLLSFARSALPGLAVWKRTGVCKIRALHSRYCTHNHVRNIRYYTLPQQSNLQSTWSVTILEKKNWLCDIMYFCIIFRYEWIQEFSSDVWIAVYGKNESGSFGKNFTEWCVFTWVYFLQAPPQISFINYIN